MIEVGVAIASASAALKLVDQGIKTGKSVYELMPAFSKFWNARDQVALANEQANNPSKAAMAFNGESVEAYALKTALANKKAKQLEHDIREIFVWSQNEDVYIEMMRLREAERKRRIALARAEAAKKRLAQDVILGVTVFSIGLASFLILIYALLR